MHRLILFLLLKLMESKMLCNVLALILLNDKPRLQNSALRNRQGGEEEYQIRNRSAKLPLVMAFHQAQPAHSFYSGFVKAPQSRYAFEGSALKKKEASLSLKCLMISLLAFKGKSKVMSSIIQPDHYDPCSLSPKKRHKI